MLRQSTLVLFLISAISGGAEAQSPAVKTGAARAVSAASQIQGPPRIGVGILQVKLGLDEAIEMALKNNLEIEIERQNRADTYQGIKAALGAYDLNFRFQSSLENRATPTGSILQAADGRLVDRIFGQNFYLRQPLPWHGLSLQADFENGRSSTNNPFVSLNPYVTSRLNVGFTLPLLRNREIDSRRAGIKISRKQAELSDVAFKLRVIDVVTRVQQAYWDLVAARQDAQVNGEAVELAREQLARTRRMIESGTLAPVELAASEAELERRLDTYIASVGMVTEAENALKTLLAPGKDSPLWSDEIVPLDDSRDAEPPIVEDLREAIAQAVAKRPELQSVGLQKEVNNIQRELDSNQTKPEINLVGAYINSGLGGTVASMSNPFSAQNEALYQRLNQLSVAAGLPPLPAPTFGGLPDKLVGGYGTALSNLFGGNFQTYQAGLVFDFNIRNRTAEANLAKTAIADRRLELERARTEQAIAAQVRNALQALETARQRIAAARASERAAREKLESETRLFQNGESTNFLVLTRQNEYSESRRRVVLARLDHNRAVARLEQALGTTLERHQISID